MNLITIQEWVEKAIFSVGYYNILASLFAALAFMVIHAIWVRSRRGRRALPEEVSPETVSSIPENVPRHSLVARIFHWLMAAAMLTLLFSAFLPKVGVNFHWVWLHWVAGAILTLSIVFHIIHAILYMEFWSIWPDRTDFTNIWHGMSRVFGIGGRTSGKPGKYPLGNKLYHLAIMVCGLCIVVTGVLMMWHAPTPFVAYHPEIPGDTATVQLGVSFDGGRQWLLSGEGVSDQLKKGGEAAWGKVYLLHWLTGIALIALVIIHVYFALRPEKLPITRAIFYGSMNREYYLKHHDPQQWVCDQQTSRQP